MELYFTFTSTDIVAWWGAIVATSVLLWDIYKWRSSGAKLRFLVQTNMKMFGDPERENDTLVTIKVTNIGDRPTTITTVGFKYYDSLWTRLRNKPAKAFVAPNPAFNHQVLPYILEVGQEWMGGTRQTEELEQLAKKGHLIAEVYNSVHKKPVSGRVIINE